MVVFIVLTVELTSSRLRARLRPEEDSDTSLVDAIKSLGDVSKWLGTNPGKK
jgi:phosphonate transport system permease protein